MTTTDAMGYVAASLVLATFCAKQMVSLRALAISSNVAFITYGLAAQLWPIVMLHVIMLPLNVIRLRDALASLGAPSCTGVGTGHRGTRGKGSIVVRRTSMPQFLGR